MDHYHEYNNDENIYRNSNSESLQITSNDDINGHVTYVNEYFNTENEDEFGHIQVNNEYPKKASEETKGETNSNTTSILLNSMPIFLEIGHNEQSLRSLKVECQLWTSGFDRSFKVGFSGKNTILHNNFIVCYELQSLI